jgi:hypothetical protein
MIKICNKNVLEQGYVFLPYIIQTTTSIISDKDKSYMRKSKINKIFNKGFFIDSNKTFSPKKSIKSRYSKKIINFNMYGVVGTSGHPGNPGFTSNDIRKLKINKIFN